MKMYKKEELQYVNGYILKGEQVIGIDNRIVDLFNEMETDVQQAAFYAENTVEPVPEPAEFVRKTERKDTFCHVVAVTPELDEAVEKAMKIMDEFDDMDSAKRANEYFDYIHDLFVFVEDEFVIDTEQGVPHRFDLPTLGNPLELDKEKLADFVIEMFL